MKQLILLLFILSCALMGFAYNPSEEMVSKTPRSSSKDLSFKSSGINEEKTFDLSGYHSVSVTSAFEVNLICDGTEGVKALIDQTMMPYFKPRVKSGVLYIEWDPSVRSISIQQDPKIYVEIHLKSPMEMLSFTGSCRASLQGVLKFDELMIRASGASRLNDFKCSGQRLGLSFSGASRGELEANVVQLDLEQTGSSNVELQANTSWVALGLSGGSQLNSKISSDHMELSASGASHVTEGQWLVSQNITIDLSGSAQINAQGSASQAKLQASGASAWQGKRFVVKTLEIHASGAASVKMAVQEQIQGRLSGASKLLFSGQANTQVSSSGAASVSRMDD